MKNLLKEYEKSLVGLRVRGHAILQDTLRHGFRKSLDRVGRRQRRLVQRQVFRQLDQVRPHCVQRFVRRKGPR